MSFVQNKLKYLKKHKFRDYIEILRHTHIHDVESYYKKPQYVKRIQKIKDIYYDLIEKRHPETSGEFSIDFLEIQLQILNLCIDYLDEQYKDLSK